MFQVAKRLTQRSDDTAAKLKTRLKMYHDNIGLVESHYKGVPMTQFSQQFLHPIEYIQANVCIHFQGVCIIMDDLRVAEKDEAAPPPELFQIQESNGLVEVLQNRLQK